MYQISGLLLKNCDREVPEKRTAGQTYREPKQGKLGRNRNSSLGSVLASKHYQFVKQCWLVNITGFYGVQISGKVPVSPSAFQTGVAPPENFHFFGFYSLSNSGGGR